MKFLKWLGILILVLALVYLILCLFGPKEMRIERSISVNASPEFVMSKLVDHKYFVERWSPWTEKDPNAKYTYEGTPGTVGHKVTWDGNDEVGNGSLTFDTITPTFVSHVFRMADWEPAQTYMKVEAEEKGSKVTWGMYQTVGFIGRGFMVIMNFDKMLGADYEAGLKKLKDAVEKDAAAAPAAQQGEYTISEAEWPERVYFGKTKKKANVQQLGTFFGEVYPAVFADIGAAKLEPVGSPSALFWNFDEKTMEADVTAGIPVSNAPKTLKSWERIVIPASKVLVLDFYGDFGKNYNAYVALDEHMKKMNREMHVAIEEYVTDPMVEKDTAKWLTKIYYVLK